MFWVWTGKENRQLMNVKSLQCMQRLYLKPKTSSVRMKPCEENSIGQNIMCTSKGQESKMEIAWEGMGTQFLHLKSNYALISKQFTNQLWKTDKNQLCGSEIMYAGKR